MKRKLILSVLLLAFFLFPLSMVNADVTPGITKCKQETAQILNSMSAACQYANKLIEEVEDTVFPYQQFHINMEIKSANLIDYTCDDSFKENSTLGACTDYWEQACMGAYELEIQNRATDGELTDRISTISAIPSGNGKDKGNELVEKIEKIKTMTCGN